ncbi:hypothetical protein EJ04DRAFT_428482 [Polyplosphaeria fusca]|uniref:Uncharacterized protein n=1 Tax=Polyplosphaeria fusca TaxID=682080 RepID=A0A9P4R4M5_9PLEO|nr:hypothetical protein EJ04DRAFT_428482 [Polyplosphaeria fusca]
MSKLESHDSDEEHLLPKDGPGSSPVIHLATISDKAPRNTISAPTAAELTNQPLRRRFWKHEIILILVPLTTTIYFFYTWRRYLTRDKDEPLKYGSSSEIWINYSWFLIPVFGLGLAKYGIVGVEAAMLQSTIWQLPDTAAYLIHGDSSWSSPEEWGKVLVHWVKKLAKFHRARNGSIHRLWSLLAFLSLWPFMAFTFVGLSLELSDGFVETPDAPMVIGHTWDDFHSRQDLSSTVLQAWQTGAKPQVPGVGVIYTPDYLDRRKYSSLDHLPNSLPLDEKIPELFLAPQAKQPVSGHTWGLRVGYNCSPVADISEFTILNDNSVSPWLQTNDTYDTASGQKISIFDTLDGHGFVNIMAYVEIGVSSNISTYYDGTEPSNSDADGNDKADILEYLLWQIQATDGDKARAFNGTLEPTVKGLGQPFEKAADGGYTVNQTFFKSRGREPYEFGRIWPPRKVLSIAPPIGVRCRIVSALGTAELDPARATFHSFNQTPPPVYNSSLVYTETPRLGNIAAESMLHKYLELLTSTNTFCPQTVFNSASYPSFVQPQILRKSIMTALAMDALYLMYDGTFSGFDCARINHNLTSSRPGKVLTTGVIPPHVPAIGFAMWTLGSLLLVIVYGFRPRWSESLDGSSLFWRGVELADEAKDCLAKGRDREGALADLQGSIRYC